MEPKGLHRYWKAEFLPGLSSEFLDAFRSGALRVTSPLSQSVIFHLGGAAQRPRRTTTGRSAIATPATSAVSTAPGPPTPPDPHVAWVRDGWERIRPFSTGGNYVNFQLAEDDTDRTAAAYGTNYRPPPARQGQYDPDNLFRVNRNIPPAT